MMGWGAAYELPSMLYPAAAAPIVRCFVGETSGDVRLLEG